MVDPRWRELRLKQTNIARLVAQCRLRGTPGRLELSCVTRGPGERGEDKQVWREDPIGSISLPHVISTPTEQNPGSPPSHISYLQNQQWVFL